MTDLIVIAVVLCLVAGVSYYMWKRKKTGKSSGCGCGSSCDGCGGDCDGH